MYEGSRHNVGYAVVDRLAARLRLRWKRPVWRRYAVAHAAAGAAPLYLVKPLTYMNASGEILAAVLRHANARLPEVVVVCDSLDLPAGQCRLRARGSAGGQKGLESLIRHAGTTEIVRLVIGIGRPDSREDIVPWVLSRPGPDEAAALDRAVNQAADALLRLRDEGAERVMNEINRKAAGTG